MICGHALMQMASTDEACTSFFQLSSFSRLAQWCSECLVSLESLVSQTCFDGTGFRLSMQLCARALMVLYVQYASILVWCMVQERALHDCTGCPNCRQSSLVCMGAQIFWQINVSALEGRVSDESEGGGSL